MRRLILEEPVSRAAHWSSRLAWISVLATAIAVAILRFGLVDLQPGLAAFGAGLALAGLAVFLALAAYLRIWREGRRGVGAATAGLLVGLLVLAYPGYLTARALLQPALVDVSTDVAEPPSFSRSRAALEARGGRVPPDPDPSLRAEQRTAFPRIASLTLDVPVDQAFALTRQAAEKRGWRIVETVSPGGRSGQGRIEAVARTLILRLPQDVTIRVRPRADGARIDLRVASRIGPHDFGSNTRLVRTFLEEVSELALAL